MKPIESISEAIPLRLIRRGMVRTGVDVQVPGDEPRADLRERDMKLVPEMPSAALTLSEVQLSAYVGSTEPDAGQTGVAEQRSLVDRAVESGRAEGYAEGLRQAQSEMEEVLETLLRLADEFRKAETAAIESLTTRLIEVSFEALVKISGEQSCTAMGVRGLVETAIAESKADLRARTIRLSSSDLSMLKIEAPQLIKDWESGGMQAVSDPRVGSGGCIIEGERGNVDARLETQLARLGEALAALC
jgi:flagellar biosynthesis/type III secretory pathway protein FliH